MRRLHGLLIFAALLANQPAHGQDTLDVREGRVFAQRTCSHCHGIVPGAPSPVAGAPNFQSLAATPGISELALRVALETPHHSMPNMMLSAGEKQVVIAYIMSLRPRN